MNEITPYLVPIASLCVSFGTFIVSAYFMRNKDKFFKTDAIQDALMHLEKRLGDCESRRDELYSENVSLMKKLIGSK